MRSAAVMLGVLLLANVGCSRRAEYLEIARAQQATWEETAKILSTIKDEASMEAAKDRFTELTVRGKNLAQKAKALPRPPEDVLDKLEEERARMQQAANRMQAEIARIRTLPGGADFLRDVEEIVRGSQ